MYKYLFETDKGEILNREAFLELDFLSAASKTIENEKVGDENIVV